MKGLIIGFSKVNYMPYINMHIKLLKESGAEVDLVTWNREVTSDIKLDGINLFEFSYFLSDEVKWYKKVKGFIKFRKFVNKILKQNNYDYIIIPYTTTAVLFFDKLIFRYKNKYIYDYRDVTHDKHWLYRKIVSCLVKKSKITLVSSDGFRKFIPSISKVHTINNYSNDENFDRNTYKKKIGNPIKIGFWGLIRHYDVNFQMISIFANDKRFELHYYGRMQETATRLLEYVEKSKIDNVFFHGTYIPSERLVFINNIDIIHNCYENTFQTKMAMGNKFYDGLQFYKPQLCTIGSYMGEIVQKYKVGLIINFENTHQSVSDKVYNYLMNLNYNNLYKNIDEVNELKKNENVVTYSLIKNIYNSD